MVDIETAITGKTVEEALLEANIPSDGIEIKASDRKVLVNGEALAEEQYEKLKKAEVKTNWLRQEGTVNFIDQLIKIREEKLIEAENYAKQGLNENSIRLILKCAALRETIEIIKEI